MNTFGFAEVVSIVSKYGKVNFLPGMRSLFLRS